MYVCNLVERMFGILVHVNIPSYGKRLILVGIPSWLKNFLQHLPRVS